MKIEPREDYWVHTGWNWRYFRRVRSGPKGGKGWEYQVAGPEWWSQQDPDPLLPWWPSARLAFENRPTAEN